MRIFTRYVLADLLRVFFMALVALTGLMLIGGVVREGMAKSLPPFCLLQLAPYLLPQMLCVTVPMTLLLAASAVYARMASDNEIVAIKALGISPAVMVWPALVAAFLLSLTAVWLNDLAASWGSTGAQRIVLEAVEEIAYGILRTEHQYATDTFSIVVWDTDGRRLIRPTLTLTPRGRAGPVTIVADEAELRVDRGASVLKIILQNCRVDVDGSVAAADRGSYEYEIPLEEASRSPRAASHPTFLPLAVIPHEVAQQRNAIERHEQSLAAATAQEMLLGEWSRLGGAEWQQRQKALDTRWSRLHRLRLEPHRRWSAGMSCFCFLWVGVPMAIRLRNRDFLTTFFLCFLPILVVYYPLFIYGIDGSKTGRIPPIAIWSGNAILLAWGAVLFRKVLRY